MSWLKKIKTHKNHLRKNNQPSEIMNKFSINPGSPFII